MIDNALPPTLEESFAAAQAWWRGAGVDLTFHDEPQGWLAEDAPEEAPTPKLLTQPAKPAPPTRPKIGGDASAWPHDFPAFRRWWLEEASLDEGGSHPRVAPRGEACSPLMLLVPMPETEDGDTLLSGPEGRLLASLVSAMGLSAEAVYVAAALPRHSLLPDWERLRGDGLGDVLLHHIDLAAPQRLIVLGTRILPLLGHDPAQAAPAVRELTIQGRSVPMLASYAPERLLGHARLRAGLWRAWLDWTDEGPG